MTSVRIATRASNLALVQANAVADRIRAANPGIEVVLVEITTAGDRDQTTPLVEGQGWFTAAVQDALLANTADIAVHSYKDLPTTRPPGLVIAAVPMREDPHDAFISRSGKPLRKLPAGATVGTSSPRRAAQLAEMRPDIELVPIRGNVETRIAKVERGDCDATVLALAGLRRLGLEGRAAQVFRFEEMLPAPAQGALAVECRADDAATRAICASIDDPRLRLLVSAERGFLATLGQGCDFPAGAYAETFGSTLKLHGFIAVEGRIVRSKVGGAIANGAGLGQSLAQELLDLTR